MKQKKLRSLSAVLLIGWCLIFLRCETTEKSMVRALYLAQKEQSITVGLLYQAPEAAADASEASGAVQLQLAQADTLAKALAAAQKQLPQKADYRLCDYLLIDQDASAELLAAYERTVLENRQGRVSAKVSVLEMDDGFLEELPAEKQEFPNKLLEQLKQCADQMPRLYQYQDGMLLPQLRAEKQEVALADTSILWRVENSIELEARQAETARLLREMGGVHTFWLEGEPVTVRRRTEPFHGGHSLPLERRDGGPPRLRPCGQDRRPVPAPAAAAFAKCQPGYGDPRRRFRQCLR